MKLLNQIHIRDISSSVRDAIRRRLARKYLPWFLSMIIGAVLIISGLSVLLLKTEAHQIKIAILDIGPTPDINDTLSAVEKLRLQNPKLRIASNYELIEPSDLSGDVYANKLTQYDALLLPSDWADHYIAVPRVKSWAHAELTDLAILNFIHKGGLLILADAGHYNITDYWLKLAMYDIETGDNSKIVQDSIKYAFLPYDITIFPATRGDGSPITPQKTVPMRIIDKHHPLLNYPYHLDEENLGPADDYIPKDRISNNWHIIATAGSTENPAFLTAAYGKGKVVYITNSLSNDNYNLKIPELIQNIIHWQMLDTHSFLNTGLYLSWNNELSLEIMIIGILLVIVSIFRTTWITLTHKITNIMVTSSFMKILKSPRRSNISPNLSKSISDSNNPLQAPVDSTMQYEIFCSGEFHVGGADYVQSLREQQIIKAYDLWWDRERGEMLVYGRLLEKKLRRKELELLDFILEKMRKHRILITNDQFSYSIWKEKGASDNDIEVLFSHLKSHTNEILDTSIESVKGMRERYIQPKINYCYIRPRKSILKPDRLES